DAGRARPRAARRALRTVGRRRARARRAGAQAPHGAHLRRTRRRRNHCQCDRAAESPLRVNKMAVEPRLIDIENAAVRRAVAGENFWQYRRFMSGEPSQNVDWRRSARDEHLYVREREWEASHTVWIW